MAHENVYYSFPLEITKEEAQSLQMKIRNAESYFKETTVRKITRTSANFGKTRLLPLVKLEHRNKLSTNYSSDERGYEIVEVHFAEMGRVVVTLLSKRTLLHCSCM